MNLRLPMLAFAVLTLSGCVTTSSHYVDEGYYSSPDAGYASIDYDEGYDDGYYSDAYPYGQYDTDDGFYLDPDADYGFYGYGTQAYDDSVYYGDYAYYRMRPIVQISYTIILGYGRHAYWPYDYNRRGYYPYAYWGGWPGYYPSYHPHKPSKPRKPKPPTEQTPPSERPIVDRERPRQHPGFPESANPRIQPRVHADAIGNGSNPELVIAPQERSRREAPRQRGDAPAVMRQPAQNNERNPRDFVMLQRPQRQAPQVEPRAAREDREVSENREVRVRQWQSAERTQPRPLPQRQTQQAEPSRERQFTRERTESAPRPAKSERVRESRQKEVDEP